MRKVTCALSVLLALGTIAAVADDGAEKPIASSAEEAKPLKAGDKIPAATLRDIDGNSVELAAIVSKQKTAIIFYRGGWCPYCNKHLSEIQSIQGQLEAKGYQIIAISPDSPEKLREAAEKKKPAYALYSDSGMGAARAFGLAFRLDTETLDKYKQYRIDLSEWSGGANKDALPVPAFYLAATDGTITFGFSDPDYTKRVAKEDVLAAIE